MSSKTPGNGIVRKRMLANDGELRVTRVVPFHRVKW